MSVYYVESTGTLVITLTTTDGWVMTETHVSVASNPADIPPTNMGNPTPGQFEYSTAHNPGVTTYTYDVPWDGSSPVYVAAHAALVHVNVAGPFWASSVVGSSLGGRTAVDDVFRLLPESALGAPDGTFFSMGIAGNFSNPYSEGTFTGGTLTVAFDGLVWNVPGNDVSVHEVTGGRATYPEELAQVWALYNGSWTMLGVASSRATDGVSGVDLGALPYAEQIRLVDVTSEAGYISGGVQGYDGFDVNAVDASALTTGQETGWGEGTQFDGMNWATYMTYEPVCAWPDA